MILSGFDPPPRCLFSLSRQCTERSNHSRVVTLFRDHCCPVSMIDIQGSKASKRPILIGAWEHYDIPVTIFPLLVPELPMQV